MTHPAEDPDTDAPRRARRPAKPGLPHSWETERTLLGGLIIDISGLPDVTRRVRVEDFHKPAHRETYKLLIELAEHGAVDVSILCDACVDRGPDRFGGLQYVLGLPQACPSVENLGTYAARVREFAIRRETMLAGQSIAEAADTMLSLPELVAFAERTISAIRRPDDSTPSGWRKLDGVVDEELAAIEERYNKPDAPVGIPTGFHDLDKKLCGLHPEEGELIILAARPAMGKSAMAVQLLKNVSRVCSAGILELEMSGRQIAGRLLANQGSVDAARIRAGDIGGGEMHSLHQAAADLRDLPVYIDDDPAASLAQIRTKAKRLLTIDPAVKVLILDYLQLADGREETREQTIAALSRGIKVLAKELRVCFIVLSQLNRNLESRADKRPMPSDLRESGAIEQDADVILFLYRDEVYNPDTRDKGTAEVIIAKQRHGPTGTVKLSWDGSLQRFASLATSAQGVIY